MTSVIMIAPLNAANFETGNAAEGQVLTSNGAGGAEMRAPAGGGGGVSSIDETGHMIVSGADEPNLNNTYFKSNQIFGGPYWASYYGIIIKSAFVYVPEPLFFGQVWVITDNVGSNYYRSNDAPVSPDLVETWVPYGEGTSLVTSVVAQAAPVPQNRPLLADGAGAFVWNLLPVNSIDISSAIPGQVISVTGTLESKFIGFGNIPLPASITPWLGSIDTPSSQGLDMSFVSTTGRNPTQGDLASCYDEGQSKVVLFHRGAAKWFPVSLGAEMQ